MHSVHRDSALGDRPHKFNYRLTPSELPYGVAPYSYEFIATRKNAQYRIRDSKDKGVGWAENEEAATYICDHLNKCAAP